MNRAQRRAEARAQRRQERKSGTIQRKAKLEQRIAKYVAMFAAKAVVV